MMDSLTVRNLTRRAFGDSAYYQSTNHYQKYLHKLKSLPAIYDAYSFPGQYDIVMSYKAPNYEQLMKTTVEQLAHTDGIWRSETLFAYQPNLKA